MKYPKERISVQETSPRIDYLLKPFDFERFYKAVQKARAHLQLKNTDKLLDNDSEFITVKVDYNNIKINVNDILYIESLDNYIKIYLDEEKKYYMPKMSLKAILSLLPQHLFIRVHKSYAVAKNKIVFFSRKQLSVKNINIPIGRTYLPNFIDEMKSK